MRDRAVLFSYNIRSAGYVFFFFYFGCRTTDYRPVTRDGRKASLFLNSVWILKLEILGIVFPRLATIALTLAQPFLVSQALRFLAMPKDEHSDNIGYGLIGAFAFVFVGSAVRSNRNIKQSGFSFPKAKS